MQKILIVEDDKKLSKELEKFLSQNGYEISRITSFENIINDILNSKCNMVLLDINLPGNNGEYICKEVRKISEVPIVMITSVDSELDQLISLNYGADDYITKPFRIQELRARVAAHLRREKREHHSTLSFEPDIRFDLSAKVLYVSEQPVPLTKSEYSICEYLAKNRGQVFTKEQIYEAVFGFDGIGDNSTISTHIKNIRAKLEHFKISPISTVWGIGYKWE